MRCVVTGGSGFLGRHLVRKLVDRQWHVVIFDIRPFKPDVVSDEPYITARVGTIAQLGDVVSACRDVDVVFHCVSADPLASGDEALMWSINVEGTKNVIEACKQCAVLKLVFVSSASVVFDGSHMLNTDESRAYPRKYIDFYSQSKAEAERLVLAASRATLLTCSLRPSSIFGEGDPVFVPRLIEAAKQGKTKYIIGDGNTKWEFTYVGNIADACIQAAEHLAPGSKVAGQAYFITNDETTLFWAQCGVILGKLGYPVPSVCIPFILCYVIATILDFFLLLLSPFYKPARPPTFTRHRVLLLNTHRQLSCAKAKRDFGYKPAVTMEEAIDRTVQFFKK